VHVFDPQETILLSLRKQFPGIITSSTDRAGAAGAEVVFLAVHPPAMMETLAGIRNMVKPDAILVSLAPKITMQKISDALGGFVNIARINPSASTVINKGLNPVCFSPQMAEEKKADVVSLMQHLGKLPQIAEHKIEAYAMISAMGHTYFWPQIEKLRELAVSFGMDDVEAKAVIAEMLHGTVNTLFKSGLSYAEVVDLIPVKPLGDVESTILGYYDQYLNGLYQKIKA